MTYDITAASNLQANRPLTEIVQLKPILLILLELLTHRGRGEVDNISQTTFSNVFSSLKMFEIWLKFHWRLFLRIQLTIFQYWFR